MFYKIEDNYEASEVFRLCAVRCAAQHTPFYTRRCLRCPALRQCAAHAAVRNDCDADVIYYLNRTRLPVIGDELYRIQLS